MSLYDYLIHTPSEYLNEWQREAKARLMKKR